MSRSFGATEFTRRSPMKISPEVTLSRPAIIASSVDLPQPEGPTSATNSPVLASRSTPFRTSTTPKFLRRFLTVSDAILLDCPLSEPADKILAAEEVDEKRRQCADQHRGT